jgi:hypothetical protein
VSKFISLASESENLESLLKFKEAFILKALVGLVAI